MRLVCLGEAAPGAILVQDVTDRRGRLLISADTRLSPKQIEALRIWGVTHVAIEDVSVRPLGLDDLLPDERERVVAHVGGLFCNADLEHPLIAELHRIAILRHVEAVSDVRNESGDL